MRDKVSDDDRLVNSAIDYTTRLQTRGAQAPSSSCILDSKFISDFDLKLLIY